MDNHDYERDGHEKRNLNTEYVPTKCRVTRPPPPKPATNPLQFIKVNPCPLFQKAHEQIKKVEEIKKERKEIRDETEDWQQNLDNWKSSRRKRQEHIIERVVEVKKLTEQEELDKSRRKSKTFSEMLEERNQKGRPKFTIPIYNDEDSNDLSDYGIGSSSSKTNSIKDADTDDSNSILDEKEHRNLDSPSSKDISMPSNLSHSENETIKDNNTFSSYLNNNIPSPKNTNLIKQKPAIPPKRILTIPDNKNNEDNSNKESYEHYTYDGAIQEYRNRIQSRIKVSDAVFDRHRELSRSKEYSEAQSALPKGEISKRKGLFETSKSVEFSEIETASSRRLSEDFANARSIKDRLKSLVNNSDQSATRVDKDEIQVSVKQRLASFNRPNEIDMSSIEKPKPSKISNYLLDKSSSVPVIEIRKPVPSWKTERCSSPETEMYMNKLNMFNRDLDNLMGGKSIEDNLDDYCSSNSNYPPSTSSVELAGVLSDREDSGIHTADVSCSVSQADEPIDTDSDTIPNCIEKLKKTEELRNQIISEETCTELQGVDVAEKAGYSREEIIDTTKKFLDDLIRDATENISAQLVSESAEENEVHERHVPKEIQQVAVESQVSTEPVPPEPAKRPSRPAIYENIELKTPPNTLALDFITADFALSPSKLEPPKEKPPPPPPQEDDDGIPTRPVRRLNSTKRIKKEIHSKRSSFLGIEDSTVELDLDQIVQKPPDISAFLQKEQKLEKSMYRKMQDETRSGLLSKVESQDSGLDIDRGRLSSDTWCSSTPSHERQDSEHTNSITSEEDEITKKEREIIEMVEKEEKSRDKNDYIPTPKPAITSPLRENGSNFEPTLGNEQFNNPYFPQTPDYLDDQDSEVLKVEHELRQLEREELQRQRENLLFRESRNRARLQANRHSLENICDDIYPSYNSDYRKSMPELQHVNVEYRKSISDVPSAYYENSDQLPYRQSMPDIQHAYQSTGFVSNNLLAIDHRKSMPDLQQESKRSAFIAPQPMARTNVPKPARPIQAPKPRILTKPSLKALSAVPRSRHTDNWITPKANPEVKSYNKHWVFQEAELRRITDQQQKAASTRNSWQQRQDKPLPDAIINTITQRVQNRNSLNERNQPLKSRPEIAVHKDFNHHSSYSNHLLPSVPFSQPATDENLQDRMLSVSGKKKCSYCSNELGRGAAMIIESLCLFYHMECFKCCVCHIQLGDGRMGTDVRVRNQKLHCHNCYSSDDGVKFSCV
ncbi:spindle pole body component 110 [Sitophilus oryzae]|uniref:Spindle pole body component 110 n=1 Tax=Sitophilus oryzae TaxID=7048 RepID=A0A6J2XZS5_SITOR|nr:spindle pole body component 110 [Sitophilus oryzae]